MWGTDGFIDVVAENWPVWLLTVVLVVAADSHRAPLIEIALRVFAADLPVNPFPDWETLPYDLFAPHPDMVSQKPPSGGR